MPDSGAILIVDDDEATLDLIVDVLSPEGYTVEAYRDGASALNAIKHQQPALILLDVVMPHTSGLQVLRDVRSWGMGHIPVVLVTATRCTREYIQEQGATAYLEKPFDLDALLDCVARYVPQNQKNDGSLSIYGIGDLSMVTSAAW